MRLVGLTVCLFMNIVFLGMGAYLYLLWIQYWRYAQSNTLLADQTSSSKNHSRRDLAHEIEIRKGRPMFFRAPEPPTMMEPESAPTLPPTSAVNLSTTTTTPMPRHLMIKAIENHKMKLTVQLRTYQMDGGNLLFKHENKYGVNYRGVKIKGEPTRESILCALRKAEVRALRDGDEPFTRLGVAKYFPSTTLLEGRYFNTCAVVSSAASLKGSGLGDFIDSHDAIVRFNHAPTKGFEEDVGSRTTLRIVNSQVVTKPEFDFWDSPLYRDVALLVWDPCNYTATLEQWYETPDFDVFPVYFRRRLMVPQEDLHLLHPQALWKLWNTLQKHTRTNMLPNPPSSGFLGLAIMLSHCATVNLIEYIPSLRLSKQCHYWEEWHQWTCTLRDWNRELVRSRRAHLLERSAHINEFESWTQIPEGRMIRCSS
ncbi:unnamed protein product, partial [Meganyctiphanes norvegica]